MYSQGDFENLLTVHGSSWVQASLRMPEPWVLRKIQTVAASPSWGLGRALVLPLEIGLKPILLGLRIGLVSLRFWPR